MGDDTKTPLVQFFTQIVSRVCVRVRVRVRVSVLVCVLEREKESSMRQDIDRG